MDGFNIITLKLSQQHLWIHYIFRAAERYNVDLYLLSYTCFQVAEKWTAKLLKLRGKITLRVKS